MHHHILAWLAITLFGLLFFAAGAFMLASPQAYLRLIRNGAPNEPSALLIKTRIRGAIMVATVIWAAWDMLLRPR
jgi:hypothetical protein